jgi:hypothetical protein
MIQIWYNMDVIRNSLNKGKRAGYLKNEKAVIPVQAGIQCSGFLLLRE